MQAGQSARQLSRDGVVDRKTARRYFEAARACGVERETELDDGLVAEVASRIQARPETPPSEPRKELEAHRPRIEDWLRGERPLRLVRVHELLARDGIEVAYTTLRRFAHDELGWRERTPTVRVDDPPPGEEAQIDFGHVGFVTDDEDKRRKLWALVVTLTVSRYMFVWPLLVQTTVAFCEGLDAAWPFFGGVPKRIVPDNMTSAVVRPDAKDPGIQRGFLEYAQARGFFVDPARVRRPQDKPRVENQIAYVRERCFDGETFASVDDARGHAERWCRDVAGRACTAPHAACRVRCTRPRRSRTCFPRRARPSTCRRGRVPRCIPTIMCRSHTRSTPSRPSTSDNNSRCASTAAACVSIAAASW